jgi:hypothetical protein
MENCNATSTLTEFGLKFSMNIDSKPAIKSDHKKLVDNKMYLTTRIPD